MTASHDVVLVLGGSRDHTAAVLQRCGRLIVRGVALRPAHPILLAIVDGTPVVGVTGYPVSAALASERLVEPVLCRRHSELVVPVVLEAQPGRDPLAWPQSRRGGALAAFARADGTLSVPACGPSLDAGQSVLVALR